MALIERVLNVLQVLRVGTKTDDGSGARVQVNGDISEGGTNLKDKYEKKHKAAFRAQVGVGQTGTLGANASANPVAYGVEDYDIGLNYDQATYKFTAPTGGVYAVSARASIGVGGATKPTVYMYLVKNGVIYTKLDEVPEYRVSSDGGAIVRGSTHVKLAAGDTLHIRIDFSGGTSGQGWLVSSAALESWFAVAAMVSD